MASQPEMPSEKEIALRMTEDVASFREKLDSFVATMQTSLGQAASEHHSEEKANEAVLQSLTDKENALRDQSTELNKSYEITRVKVASATASKTRLEAELKTLPKAFDALQASVLEAEDSLEKDRIEINEKRMALQKNQQALTQALEFFNSRLGLFFEREEHGGNGIRLKATFTCLGENYSDRASFCIDIDGGKYVVTDCNPQIDPEEIVQRLQKTDDLSHFFQAMRRAFQAHCTAR